MNTDLTPKETLERITEIVKQTDWRAYWEEQANSVLLELEAYEEARRESLEHVDERVLR